MESDGIDESNINPLRMQNDCVTNVNKICQNVRGSVMVVNIHISRNSFLYTFPEYRAKLCKVLEYIEFEEQIICVCYEKAMTFLW